MRKYAVTFKIQDASGKQGFLSLWMQTTDDLSDTAADPARYALRIAQFIDPLIRGVIDSINVTELVTIPNDLGIKTQAEVDADVEEAAEWVFKSAHKLGYMRFTMPAIREPILFDYGTAGTRIDETIPEVNDFIEIITSPQFDAAGWIVTATDNRWQDITQFVGGKEAWKARRRK